MRFTAPPHKPFFNTMSQEIKNKKKKPQLKKEKKQNK